MTTVDAHLTGDHVEANAQCPCGVPVEETLKCTDPRHECPNQKSDACSDR